MICLDTNYLILALVPGSQEAQRIVEWCARGESLYVPAVVWYEFICGPVTGAQAATIRALLQEIVPFDEAQAQEAARLFNACGRKRHLHVDAMIAAAATARHASLATGNADDFRAFVGAGLVLAS
jgi:predicted nucleic acid-binding protein